MKIIHLAGLNLTKFPVEFEQLQNLTHINMEMSSIYNIPAAFHQLQSLEFVNIKGTYIKDSNKQSMIIGRSAVLEWLKN